MTITRFDIEQLEKQSQFMVDLCKQVKKSIKSSSDKLFATRTEYDEALKAKNMLPDDYYYFRCFDVQSKISFNLRLKKYCILLEGSYSDVLDSYKKLSSCSDVFIISDSFETTLTVWHDVVYDVLRNKVLQNGLF